MNKFKRFLKVLFLSASISLLPSCGILGNQYGGVMISGITATTNANGETELTITFTDEDIEPVTFVIPQGEQGETGAQGAPGVGISTINVFPSEDGTYSTIVITYTDSSIPSTSFIVENGVSVINITSSINIENNSTIIEFHLSNGETKQFEITNGKDGVGIESVTEERKENGDVVITITYTDGREPSVITLPYKNGEDGRGIQSIIGTQNGNYYVLTIIFTDGTSTELTPIELPETTKWLYGQGAPNFRVEEEANPGDYYFDLENYIIYLYDGTNFNPIINLTDIPSSTKKYTVSFDANGGSFTSSIPTTITVDAGKPIDASRIPTCYKENCKFIGYYTTPEGPLNPLSGKLTDLVPIYSDYTFYASYEEI